MAPQIPKQQSVPFTGSWAKVKSANAKMKQQLMDGQHVVAWVGCTVQITWLFTTFFNYIKSPISVMLFHQKSFIDYIPTISPRFSWFFFPYKWYNHQPTAGSQLSRRRQMRQQFLCQTHWAKDRSAQGERWDRNARLERRCGTLRTCISMIYMSYNIIYIYIIHLILIYTMYSVFIDLRNIYTYSILICVSLYQNIITFM